MTQYEYKFFTMQPAVQIPHAHWNDWMIGEINKLGRQGWHCNMPQPLQQNTPTGPVMVGFLVFASRKLPETVNNPENLKAV